MYAKSKFIMNFFRRPSRGFTFLELLIAVCILAVSIVGLLALYSQCMFLSQRAQSMTVATSHAEYVLEQIHRTAFASIASTNWTTWAQGAGLNTLSGEAISVSVSGTDPLDITVTVSWNERGRTLSQTFNTKVTQ